MANSEERKTLGQPKRHALWTWLAPVYDFDLNKWLVRDQCHHTAKLLLREWQIEAGQESLFGEMMNTPITDEEREVVNRVWDDAQEKLKRGYMEESEALK